MLARRPVRSLRSSARHVAPPAQGRAISSRRTASRPPRAERDLHEGGRPYTGERSGRPRRFAGVARYRNATASTGRRRAATSAVTASRAASPRRVRERLQREDLDHQVEASAPLLRQSEQVGDPVVHARSGVPAARQLDRGRRDVERRGGEAERGEVLRIGAQPAADDDRAPALARRAARARPRPARSTCGTVRSHGMLDLAGRPRGVQPSSNHAVGSPRPIASAASSSARRSQSPEVARHARPACPNHGGRT